MTRHQPDFSAEKIRRRRRDRQPARFRPQSMSPAKRSISTTCRSRPAHCMPASDSPPSPMAKSSAWTSPPFASAPGVVDVLTGHDVPGENDVSPTGRHDEPLLATEKVEFFGQPVFAVIAETREAARRALRQGEGRLRGTAFVTDVGALDPAGDRLVTDPLTLKRGDAAGAIAAAPRRIKGSMRIGGPGPFLSRRPHRHGRARRGRGRHRLFLDPAPERGAAHGGTRAGGLPPIRSPSRSGAWAAASAARRPRATSSQPLRRLPPRNSAARSRFAPTATTT